MPLLTTILRTIVCAALLLAGAATAAPPTVRLGVPPWQGAQVKSAVLAELLERLGWQVEITEAAAPLIFQELGAGRLDLNVSAWIPGQDQAFQPLVEAGRIQVLGENLTGARTGLAVPVATAPEGLTSLEGLDAAGEAFERRIYCIEPGSGANAVAEEAIERDLYGLADWTLVNSSTQAMLAQVKRAARRDEAAVFCAWAPHWMNIAFELRYLDDPLGHWGGAPGSTRVLTLARAGLAGDQPELVKLMERFQVDSEVQSRWIFQFAREDMSRQAIASQWIADNPDLLGRWLEGVTAPDGTPALERLRAPGG